ncbi:hypothetical protein [Salinicola lusitanus]|uniref:hypothetical protein n=1 Tax=Salinicola lusitanus TaxID=1949085 RepID=UPI000DA22C16|nr:hypothetical protein [Salinicola lusitanus]
MTESQRWIDREAVRALAERNSAELAAGAERGDDLEVISRRHQDEIYSTHLTGMSVSEQTDFLTIYADELNAITTRTNAETERVLSEQAKTERAGQALGKVIAFFVIAGFVWLMLQKL